MSQEVAIIATVKPATGKLDRFKELVNEAIARIEADEPETLEFGYYEQNGEDGVKLTLVERYANRAAMDKHENSPQYKSFFKAVMDEGLLEGPPVLFKGDYVKAFRR